MSFLHLHPHIISSHTHSTYTLSLSLSLSHTHTLANNSNMPYPPFTQTIQIHIQPHHTPNQKYALNIHPLSLSLKRQQQQHPNPTYTQTIQKQIQPHLTPKPNTTSPPQRIHTIHHTPIYLARAY